MLGLIAGTGFYNWNLMTDVSEKTVQTPYGEAEIVLGKVNGIAVAFLPRHKKNHSIPPHKVNYRANIYALHSIGVSRVIAINAVGSIDKNISPGEIVLVDDFLDFTHDREHTFFDGDSGKVGHADMSNCYCEDLRNLIIESARLINFDLHEKGVYVATQGPRFETKAEIKAYGKMGGTVVGMTGVPECPLAVEMGICYASLSYVTNYACGVAGNLSGKEIQKEIEKTKDKLEVLLSAITKNYRDQKRCSCDAEGCLL